MEGITGDHYTHVSRFSGDLKLMFVFGINKYAKFEKVYVVKTGDYGLLALK